jgi:hypothetical protein
MKHPLPSRPSLDRLLFFCRAFYMQYDRFPSTRAITHQFDFSSQTTAVTMLLKLERAGKLEKCEYGYRFNTPGREETVANYIKHFQPE